MNNDELKEVRRATFEATHQWFSRSSKRMVGKYPHLTRSEIMCIVASKHKSADWFRKNHPEVFFKIS